FDFMDRFGERVVREHNHRLIRDAIAVLANMCHFHFTTPDVMTTAMALVPAPPGLPYPATDEGRSRLEVDLREKFHIIANPALAHDGQIWLRITAQMYNHIKDYRNLADAVLALC
ncbi:MAG: hypothetical protein JO166_21810, partial [Deltaproteobacteria bacterium]|nr:hypothetical protein [Deltaproteobacteria bacterium]